jgi:pimeloyl-ACP methyl ester carboxylesterase
MIMKPIRTFDKYYKDVPAEQRDALRRFRGMYHTQKTSVEDTSWTYRQAGYEGQALLWLVGGLRMSDAAFRSIPLLQDDFNIIAPDYPPLPTMTALADGLVGILDAVGIEKVSVLSGSYGGMLAQILVRRHPERINKVILSTTSAPDAQSASNYAEQLAMIEGLDEATLAQVAQQTMLGTMQVSDEDKAFWQAYLAELYEVRLSKADIVSTYQSLIDFMQADFHADDLQAWHENGGKMLILNSDDDGTFGKEAQTRLQILYPQADVHTFVGAGHSPSTTQRDAFFGKVREFLSTSS